DRRAMDDVEPFVFHFRDELMAECLMNLPDEFLGALRMLVALLEARHAFESLDQRGLVLAGRRLITALLYGGLDDEKVFPTAEHMRVGRPPFGFFDWGPRLVDAHRLAVELVVGRLIAARIARIGFPEIGAIEEFKAGTGDIDSLERIDE